MTDWRTANNSLRAARDAMDDHKRREHLANRDIDNFHHLGEIRLPHVEKLMRRAAQQTEGQRQAAQADHR